ncbi:MAG: HAMP domain-containing protein [Deltaproteobacteria bacterium]|nr:HAMP domain-containing protein [Deltaproteobacteria bacterium]
MKIYRKILLVTLPLALFSLFAGAGGTYYLSKQSLEHLADNWLQTRLGEAMQTVAENEEFLRRYSITDISSGVKKAQYDAASMLENMKIGKQGYVFIVDDDGQVIFHPEDKKQGVDISELSWFSEMARQTVGQLDYSWSGTRSLAAYEYFPAWKWYVVVTDPFSEIYGSINKARDLVLSLAVFGSILMVLLIIFLARKMTAPLRLLVAGAQKIGRGDLETRVPVSSNDEFGELSAAFNTMSTQLQKSHGALIQSEKLFRSLIENESGIIFLLDQDCIVRYLSPSLYRVLGYQLEELQGESLSTIVHTDDQALCKSFLNKTLLDSKSNQSSEIRLRHADGTWRIFEIISQNLLEDAAVSGIVLNSRDISIRKNVESDLKRSEERLLSLMSQLLEAQEGERKRLASELHDVVGQNLLFLKFKISLLEKELTAEQSEQKEVCEETFKYIDQIIENVRRLCWDLVPSDLEDLGLSAAITSLLEDFARHYEIAIDVKLDKIDASLTQEMQILIYRLFQEALTNIGKHADASQIQIEGIKDSSGIHFLIEDNGRGFDSEAELLMHKKGRGMGLSTMQERARILGASFALKSTKMGTSIRFCIPLKGSNCQ